MALELNVGPTPIQPINVHTWRLGDSVSSGEYVECMDAPPLWGNGPAILRDYVGIDSMYYDYYVELMDGWSCLPLETVVEGASTVMFGGEPLTVASGHTPEEPHPSLYRLSIDLTFFPNP